MARPRAMFWTILVVGSAGAAVADPGAAPPSAETRSLDGFAAVHAECRAWTDGCVICRRTAEAFACSTPGIACQPSALTCQPPPDGRDRDGAH